MVSASWVSWTASVFSFTEAAALSRVAWASLSFWVTGAVALMKMAHGESGF